STATCSAPATRPDQLSSTSSKASTTPAAATRTWATSARPSTNAEPPNRSTMLPPSRKPRPVYKNGSTPPDPLDPHQHRRAAGHRHIPQQVLPPGVRGSAPTTPATMHRRGRRLDQDLQLTAVLTRGKHPKPRQVQNRLDRAAGSVIHHWGLPRSLSLVALDHEAPALIQGTGLTRVSPALHHAS